MPKLYNTLTREKETFKPIQDKTVGLYTCGPTVYDYAHIGNMRAFIFADILRRLLVHNGYDVKHIMNITDVGHLVGDRDMGEDKLAAAAKKERKTAWEIASFYTDAFLKDIKALNILTPHKLPKATDHIKDMVGLIQELEKKDLTYKTSDGVYFDTAKLDDYGKLAKLDIAGLREGARVEINNEKRNSSDFALWKLSHPLPHPPHPPAERAGKGEGKEQNINSSPLVGEDKGGGVPAPQRDMEWDSPWGVGFPGWHIECSAMSARYLGQPFDIHTGGVDHIPVHHTNEIAQSESAFEKPLANYWVHSEFVNVADARMGKSEGNLITIEALIKKGYSPLAYRYFVLQGHYRTKLNFSFEGLEAAQNSLDNLHSHLAEYKAGSVGCAEYQTQFFAALDDDLDTPKALSVMWEMMRSDQPGEAKFVSLMEFDQVLGLSLRETWEELQIPLPDEVQKLVNERERVRQNNDFETADRLRQDIESQGFAVKDTKNGPIIKRR